MPFQPPIVVVSVWPSRWVPLSCGSVTLDGASWVMVAEGCEADGGDEPASLTAVTSTRIVLPTSAGVSV